MSYKKPKKMKPACVNTKSISAFDTLVIYWTSHFGIVSKPTGFYSPAFDDTDLSGDVS